MADWVILVTNKYENIAKRYEKKHSDELKAILLNFDIYFDILKTYNNPLLINAGFIHPETKGIIAIDQSGGRKRNKLQETRLYIYPDNPKKRLYMLTIGDKQSQSRDINYCVKEVKQIKKGES